MIKMKISPKPNVVFIPDVQVEVPDLFARDYQIKFTSTLSTPGSLIIGDRQLPPGLVDLLIDMGLFPKRTDIEHLTVPLTNNERLHDALLRKPEALDQILHSDREAFLPYRAVSESKEIAQRCNLTLDSDPQTVAYLGNKKNLDLIFPSELLPETFRFIGNQIINSKGVPLSHSQIIIAKDKDGASCIGIQKINVLDAIEAIRLGQIDLNQVLLQEYVRGEAYSITYKTDGEKIDEIFCGAQHIKEGEEGFEYIAAEMSNITRAKTSSARLHLKKIIDRDESFKRLYIFGLDFILTPEGEIRIMEINPRFPGSSILASGLERCGLLNEGGQLLTKAHFYTMGYKCQLHTFKEALKAIGNTDIRSGRGFLPLNFRPQHIEGILASPFPLTMSQITNAIHV